MSQMRSPLLRLRTANGMIVAAIIIPLMLFAAVAYFDYGSVFRQAERDVQSAIQIVRENAQDAFDKHQLVADMVRQRVAAMTWTEIGRSEAVHDYLAKIAKRYPEIQALWLADKDGLVRSGSTEFPAPAINIADREYFTRVRDSGEPLVVGRLVQSRVFQYDVFNVARRRAQIAAPFDGIIVVTAKPELFQSFWANLMPERTVSAALLRNDGYALARSSDFPISAETPKLDRDNWLIQAIRNSTSGLVRTSATIDHTARLFAYAPVPGFPLTVAFGVTTASINQTWEGHLIRYGTIFVPAAVVLVLLALKADRSARRETAALAETRRTATDLVKEAARRGHVERLLRTREAEARSQADRLLLATSIAGAGVWEWVPGADALAWDTTMRDIYGLPDNAAPTYDRWCRTVDAESLARAQASMKTMIDTRVRTKFEFRIVRGDGEIRHIARLAGLVLDDRGGVLRTLGVDMDVTERKDFEAALAEIQADIEQERQRAEAANRAKTDFLATMSHEIRTPMNGIIGMTELLLGSELSSKQRQFADAVRVSADALLCIIDAILDVAKLETGKIEIEATDFRLEDVVEPLGALLQPLAAQRGNTLTVDIEMAARVAVRGDPNRLRQVLLNLLSNAIKFTTDGKVELAIGVRSPEASAENYLGEPKIPPNVLLTMHVTDTGIGIDADAQSRLFQRFEQADGSITRRFGGSGLGLHICKELLSLMGGTISVVSISGAGSRFSIDLDLPLAHNDTTSREEYVSRQQEPVTPVQAIIGSTAKSILVVDDNEINRLLITTLLEQAGYLTASARDGAEAVSIVARCFEADQDFHLILMDVQMPVMDGVQATRSIRSLPGRARTVPIVAFTANAMSSHRQAYLDAGMDDYLCKPIQAGKTLRMVAAWVDGGRPTGSDEEVLNMGIEDTGGDSSSVSKHADLDPDAIDYDCLTTLHGALPAAKFHTIMTMFLQRDFATDIEAAASGTDLLSLSRLAHTIKGTSATLGGRQLSTLAAALEQACRAGETLKATALAARIRPVATMSQDAVRIWIEALSSAEARHSAPLSCS